MNRKQLEAVIAANPEAKELVEKLEAIVKAEKQKRRGELKLELCTTQKGHTGFVIKGMGTNKFFYVQHAEQLFADTAEAQAERVKIMAWIEQNRAVLTVKQEEEAA